MMKTLLRASLLLSAAIAWPTSQTTAQTVSLTGEVTEQNGTFGLLDTSVVLQSGALDLSNHVGQRLDLTGTLLPGSTPPQITVDSSAPAPSRLRITGDNRIGRTFSLRLTDTTAISYYVLVSLGEGFLPLDPLFPHVHGSLFLDTSILITLSSGPLTEEWIMDIAIPNDPSFAGLELLFQASVTYAGVLGESWGNMARITVET
ncbi:MAG: hypothetical protein VYE77_08290 [Planctomycetota bacterium]|nr:hypothetical protein [Planctomycetota bacterium]